MKSIEGNAKRRAYKCWHAMISRCEKHANPCWADYGGRGIRVCSEWHIFETFLNEMGLPPKDMTIERKNNNGNYDKSNCVWSTRRQQAQNRRSNTFVTIEGKTKCIAEWARILKRSPRLVGVRMFRGWTAKLALTTPPALYRRNKNV